MGWFRTAVQGLAKRAAKYAGIPLRDPALVQMLGTQPSAAGVDVDENTAMNYSAIWAAATVISTNFASMPAVPCLEVKGGFEDAVDTPAWNMLLVAPNPEMTPFVLHQTSIYHALLAGNAYIRNDKEFEEDTAREQWLLMPNQVTPMRHPRTNELFYRFTALYPGETDEDIPHWQVVHVPGLSWDGLKGYNVIEYARESIGLGIAAEKFGAAFFGRGCTPGGIIEYPEEVKMTKRARANLRESFELLHRGPDNAFRLMILEQGMQYKPVSIPPNQAQFLETRRFQILEIARWFNIPPHMLKDLDRATFSNIEHQSIEFLQQTLRPWMIKYAEEYRRKIFGRYDQKRYCVRHRTHNLLMNDMKSRYEAYAIGRNGGWLTLNDIMRLEGCSLLPSEIGDQRLVPSTMRAIGPDRSMPIKPEVLTAAIRTLMAMKPLDEKLGVMIAESLAPQGDPKMLKMLVERVENGGEIDATMLADYHGDASKEGDNEGGSDTTPASSGGASGAA